MFNLAIDSKLRGCDVVAINVVAIKVDDVAAGGYTADRATVRQKKTGRPVRFELTEQTRQAVDEYLRATNKKPACSQAVAVPKKASPRANMRAWYRIGSAVSGWIRGYMGRIHCDAPKRP